MSRRHRLALLCLGVPALAAAGCGSDGSASESGPGAGSGSTARTGTGGTTAVDLTEYRIAVTPVVEPAGRLTFAVANDGAIPHELVLLRTARKAAGLPARARSGRHGQVAKLGQDVLRVGAKKALTLDLKPGHYALICDLPGHYEGGMHADLTVR